MTAAKCISFLTTAFLLLIMTVFWPGDCRAGATMSIWRADSIKVDGRMSDWPSEATVFLPDQQTVVGLCHDSSRLYVMVRFNKPEWQQVIRMSGLTVWLDARGKKRKDFKIRFIGGPSREQMETIHDTAGLRSREPVFGDMRQRLEQTENQLLCFQKDVIIEKPVPLDGDEGPTAACGVDNGFFIYEFSVPLEESKVRFFGLDVRPEQVIGVGLVWGEIDRHDMRRSMPDMGGGMPLGGMGGPPPGAGGPGGGMGGPPERGSGRPMQPRMPEKQEIWLKAQLRDTPPAAEEGG